MSLTIQTETTATVYVADEGIMRDDAFDDACAALEAQFPGSTAAYIAEDYFAGNHKFDFRITPRTN